MSKDRLALVMPVYNESGAIRTVIEEWTKELSRLGIDFQIHAYNDGSRDDTLRILNELAREIPRLVVHNKLNSGHGPTILRGYRENSGVEWIFQVDSDNEISPEKFEDLWIRRDDYDFLVGRRVRPRQPWARKVMSAASRTIVRIFYGSTVFDVNSPYRLMRCQALKKIFFSLPDRMFAPNVVISGMVSLKRLRVYETPVNQKQRATGEVSIRKWKLVKAALRSSWQTAAYRFR